MLKIFVLFLMSVIATPSIAWAQDSYQARGLIKAKSHAILASEIAAIVTETHKRTGARFDKDAVLVEFDCRLYESQMRKTRADAKAAKAKLSNTRKLQKLRSVGKLEVTLAEADFEKATAEQTIAQLNVDRCKIRAPFAGQVVALQVRRFENVDPRQNIIEIVSTDAFEVEVIIPGAWLPRINIGQRLDMRVDETESNTTVIVDAVSGAIDPVSQTTLLRGTIVDQPAGLLPGMSGVLTF